MAKAKANSAYDSGMRGREKPGTKQGPGGKVGNPAGEAYSSGMRGSEKPKETPVNDDAATSATGNAGGAGSSHQAPGSSVGNPKGQDTSKNIAAAMSDKTAQAHTAAAHNADASTEHASQGNEPSFEEDDTHVNIRVPKTSFKRKSAR